METNRTISVLQVTIGDGNFGGVASFLYTYYLNMNHEKVHFDFLYCGENSLSSISKDPIFESSTFTTLHVLKKNNNGVSEYIKLLKDLDGFFKKNKYDIVHVNSGNAFLNICVAYKLHRRSVYIAHSHNAKSTIKYGSRIKKLGKEIIRLILRNYILKKADALYACSDEAGISLFGDKGIKQDKYKVIRNAINTNQYRYNPETRKKVLREEGKVIIGFVGRLSIEKNPLFALDVFYAALKRNQDVRLWMIGEGELQQEVEQRINKLGIQDKVVLFGRRSDIADLMQAMDVLLFPSIYEGFGIVAIEAQCAGLNVLASDQVPKATNVTGLVTYLSITESATVWADRLIEIVTNCKTRERQDYSIVVKNAHYDIVEEARQLEDNYSVLYNSFKKQQHLQKRRNHDNK